MTAEPGTWPIAAAAAGRQEPHSFKEVAGQFASGVTVVIARDRGVAAAKTVSSFVSLSLDPMLVMVAIGDRSPLVAAAERSSAFSISILREDQTTESDHYASHESRRGPEPPTPLIALPSGGVVLDDCLGWFDCRLHGVVPAGDHVVLIGRVVSLRHRGGNPLLHFRGRYCGLAENSRHKNSERGTT